MRLYIQNNQNNGNHKFYVPAQLDATTYTLAIPKHYPAGAMYVGAFFTDDDDVSVHILDSNGVNLSDGLKVTSSDPSVLSLQAGTSTGHGFVFQTHDKVSTAPIEVNIEFTNPEVPAEFKKAKMLVNVLDIDAADGGMLTQLASISHGSQITDTGYIQFEGVVTNSTGDRTEVDGEAAFEGVIDIDQGNNITTDEYRPQTQFILTGTGVSKISDNNYGVSLALNAAPVRVDVAPPAGEPGAGSAVTVVYNDGEPTDVIEQPTSGHDYFEIKPLKEGVTTLRVGGGADNVHAWLRVVVSASSVISADVTNSTGDRVEVDGSVVATGDVTISHGEQIDLTVGGEIVNSTGSQITIDDYRPQTQFILSGLQVKQLDVNQFRMYVLGSSRNVRVDVQPPVGEPGQNSSVTVVYNDGEPEDVIDKPLSGHPYFFVNPRKLGTTKLRIGGGADNVHTWLEVIVVDEYPDTILIKNGSQISIDPSIDIIIPVLHNNNDNDVIVDGYVVLGNGEDILVTNGATVDALRTWDIGVSNGSRVEIQPGVFFQSNIHVDNDHHVDVSGTVILGAGEDIHLDHGNNVDLVTGNQIAVSGGTRVDVHGWKLEPNSVVVVGGSNVQVDVGGIVVNVPEVKTSNGSQVHIGGQKPEDIGISHHTVVNVFRGAELYRGNIRVSNGETIILSGVAVGGTMPNVSVPCQTFVGSLVPSRCFVKGQIEEIPEISLDSSIKLGVKLYSCDNTLLNPSTFTSAYFTFDDELQLPANIDPVSSTISVLARPSDLAVLKRKKIYDMRLHVVDQQGNPSIVLTRKLRFI